MGDPYYIHGLSVVVVAAIPTGVAMEVLDLQGPIAVVLWAILVTVAIVVSTILYTGRGHESVPAPNRSGASPRRSTAICAGIALTLPLVLVILQVLSST